MSVWSVKKKEEPQNQKVDATTSIAQKIKEIASLMDQLEKARTKKDAKKIGEITNRLEEIIQEPEENDIQTKDE